MYEEEVPLHAVVFGCKRLFATIMDYAADFVIRSVPKNSDEIDPLFVKWLCNARFVDRVFSHKIGQFLFDHVRFHLQCAQDAMFLRRLCLVVDDGAWARDNTHKIKSVSIECDGTIPYDALNAMPNLECLELVLSRTSLNVDRLPRRIKELRARKESSFNFKSYSFPLEGTLWPEGLKKLYLYGCSLDLGASEQKALDALAKHENIEVLCVRAPAHEDEKYVFVAPKNLKTLYVSFNFVPNEGLKRVRMCNYTRDDTNRIDARDSPEILNLEELTGDTFRTGPNIMTNAEEMERCRVRKMVRVCFLDRNTLDNLWPASHLVHLNLTNNNIDSFDRLPVMPNLKRLIAEGISGELDMPRKMPRLKIFKYYFVRRYPTRIWFNERMDRIYLCETFCDSVVVKKFPLELKHLRCAAEVYLWIAKMHKFKITALTLINASRSDCPETLALPFDLEALSIDIGEFNIPGTQTLVFPPNLRFLQVDGYLTKEVCDTLPVKLEYLHAKSSCEGYDFRRFENLKYLCLDTQEDTPVRGSAARNVWVRGADVVFDHPRFAPSNPRNHFADFEHFVSSTFDMFIVNKSGFPTFDIRKFASLGSRTLAKCEAQNQ